MKEQITVPRSLYNYIDKTREKIGSHQLPNKMVEVIYHLFDKYNNNLIPIPNLTEKIGVPENRIDKKKKYSTISYDYIRYMSKDAYDLMQKFEIIKRVTNTSDYKITYNQNGFIKNMPTVVELNPKYFNYTQTVTVNISEKLIQKIENFDTPKTLSKILNIPEEYIPEPISLHPNLCVDGEKLRNYYKSEKGYERFRNATIQKNKGKLKRNHKYWKFNKDSFESKLDIQINSASNNSDFQIKRSFIQEKDLYSARFDFLKKYMGNWQSRAYHKFTNCGRIIREFVYDKSDNQYLHSEIDCASMIPFLAFMFFRDELAIPETPNTELLLNDIITGEIFTKIIRRLRGRLNRNQIKKTFWPIYFGSDYNKYNNKSKFKYRGIVWNILNELYPDFFTFFKEIRCSNPEFKKNIYIQKFKNTEFANILFLKEANVMISGVGNYLRTYHPDICWYSVHDAIVAKPQDEELIKGIMEKEFIKKYGISPSIKTKNILSN